MKNKSGFTLIEILIGLTITVAIFIIATSLVVNVFSSTTKSKQREALEQAKNDLQAEFGTSVRWADSISYISGTLAIDSASYRLANGAILKNGEKITSNEVVVDSFSVVKHQPSPVASSSPNSGTGLSAQYFDNDNLTNLVFTQNEYSLNSDWGSGSPDELIDENTFSIRYGGQIEAPTTSQYTFYLNSDDGARLWVDGQLLIDDWELPSTSEQTATINLVGGKKYDFRLEYYEKFGNAKLSLFWSYFGASKQAIPVSRFYPNSRGGSLEIQIELSNKYSPSVVETLKLVLSPRSGDIGLVE